MTKIATFDYKYDYSPVLLWQYSNAKNLRKIIEKEQSFVDTAITEFKDEFDKKIFNLNTCDSNGLDLWGRLLEIQRPVVGGIPFTDEQYRLLLLSRIALLSWDGSCFGLNKIIKKLFPNALFRVTDNFDMTANIEFSGNLTAEQIAVLSMGYLDPNSGEFVYTFLPRSAGVAYNISFPNTWNRTLGFEGMTEIIEVGGVPTLADGSTTNMGGAYNCSPGDDTGDTGTENSDGGVFYK